LRTDDSVALPVSLSSTADSVSVIQLP
jgi:hypothetical protein